MELEDLCRCKVQQLKSALESLKSLSSTGVLILGRLRTISTRLKKLEKVVEKTRPPDLKKELQNLLECLKLEPLRTPTTSHISISDLCTLYFLKNRKKKKIRDGSVKPFAKALSRCRDRLASLLPNDRNELGWDAPQDVMAYLDNAETALVYKALANHWGRCRCNPRHKVNLLLSSTANVPTAFEMLFDARPEQWRELHIQARSLRNSELNIGRRVRFLDIEDDCSSKDPLPGQPLQPEHRLCLLTQNSNQRLRLVADRVRGQLMLTYSHEVIQTSREVHFRPLRDIIRYDPQLLHHNPRDKLYLAASVTYAVIQLYGSPWLYREWSNTSITFALDQESKGNPGNILSVHLSSEIVPEVSDSLLDSQNIRAVLLDLGLLILEIESGQLRDASQSGDYHDLDAYGNPCVGSGMTTATELFERLESNVQRLVVYKDAIRACLDIGIEFTDIEQARDYIRCNVFDPLRNGLKYAFGLEFGALAPKVCSIPDQPKTSGDSSVEHVATQGSFFDSDYLPSTMAQILGDQSESWVKSVSGSAARMLGRDKAVDQSSRPRIKIALLDTGIDAKRHPMDTRKIIASHKTLDASRIADLWTHNMEQTKTMKDEHGHGTHAAGLILEVAPFANLYVAQVSSSDTKDRRSPDLQAVISAIDHAVDVWRVDIIIMSFGFPGDHPDIPQLEKKLEKASQNHTIVFAAACNHGNTRPATFPATSNYTIAVRSVNAMCTRASEFNPSRDPCATYNHNFAVVGEDVDSTWPKHLDSKGRKHQTGNSIATPILASIAANILEFTLMRLGDGDWDERKRRIWEKMRRQPNGMGIRNALACLTGTLHDKTEVDFIDPCKFFANNQAWSILETRFGAK